MSSEGAGQQTRRVARAKGSIEDRAKIGAQPQERRGVRVGVQ